MKLVEELAVQKEQQIDALERIRITASLFLAPIALLLLLAGFAELPTSSTAQSGALDTLQLQQNEQLQQNDKQNQGTVEHRE